MDTAIIKLLPYSESGIVSRQDNDILTLSGFRNGINLEALRAELETSWLELCKEEAAIRVKNALAAAQESRRPANFFDLAVKLQLGRITPAEREQLNVYYDALDELERESATLQTAIAQADSVDALNKIPWPEWVGWEPLPLQFKLLAEPEPIEPKPIEPKPIEPEPIEPESIEPESIEPESIKPDPVESKSAEPKGET